MKAELMAEISSVLEHEVTEDSELEKFDTWNSIAVVVLQAAIDDICGINVRGTALAECKTVRDILTLARA